MFTIDTISAMVALAGEDFSWDGALPGHRPSAKVRPLLRDWLIAFQGGVCVFCEQHDDAMEFCHIVSRGPGKRGFLPGCVVAGCAPCNARQKKEGPVVAFEDIARPDLIAMDWPSPPMLRALLAD